MNSSYVHSLGLATPETKFSQQQAAEFLARKLEYSEKETKKLVRLYKRTGIQFRHTVLNLEDTYFRIFDASTAERMMLYEQKAILLAEQAVTNTITPEFLSENHPCNYRQLHRNICTRFRYRTYA